MDDDNVKSMCSSQSVIGNKHISTWTKVWTMTRKDIVVRVISFFYIKKTKRQCVFLRSFYPEQKLKIDDDISP